MDIGRLRKIIEYSNKHYEETYSRVRQFCSDARIEHDSDLLNILQIVRSSFEKKGFFVFELPFADNEIGALCYKGDGLGYIVVNTTLPRVNVNFALAHEVYHVFFGESEFVYKVELANDHYYEHEEEYAANLFAGMLLMPTMSFQRMYLKFNEESNGNEIDTIIKLMSYYQVPYMAVLIRCLELKLIQGNPVPKELLSVDRSLVSHKLSDLWLDESIMHATRKDDYSHIEHIVNKLGEIYIENEYINKRTLRKNIQNMRELYAKVKGD